MLCCFCSNSEEICWKMKIVAILYQASSQYSVQNDSKHTFFLMIRCLRSIFMYISFQCLAYFGPYRSLVWLVSEIIFFMSLKVFWPS